MTTGATAIADTPPRIGDDRAGNATLREIEARTRAVAEVAEGLRPLLAIAHQAPAMVAVLMDSFDDVMRAASDQGIDVERGLLNGAEAALRFGATMDAEKVRELDALLKSGVLAPGALRIVGELGRALTDTAAAPPAPVGLAGLLRALGRPDVQRALGFVVAFAERFGKGLRELPPARQ